MSFWIRINIKKKKNMTWHRITHLIIEQHIFKISLDLGGSQRQDKTPSYLNLRKHVTRGRITDIYSGLFWKIVLRLPAKRSSCGTCVIHQIPIAFSHLISLVARVDSTAHVCVYSFDNCTPACCLVVFWTRKPNYIFGIKAKVSVTRDDVIIEVDIWW